MAGPWEKYGAPAAPQPAGPWTKQYLKPGPAPAAPAPQMSTAEDVLRSAGSGLMTGTVGVAGMPGDISNMMFEAGNWVGDRLGLPNSDKGREFYESTRILPTSPEIQGAITEVTGIEPHTPQTTPGKYVNTAASFVPGAVAFGGAKTGGQTVADALKFGIVPGVASEAAGQATEGTKLEPYARVAAALAAGGFMAAKSKPAAAGTAPSLDELRDASRALYKQAEAQGLVVEAQKWSDSVDDIIATITSKGIDPTLHPDAVAALKRLEASKGVAPRLEDIDMLRQLALDASQSVKPADAMRGSMMVEKIDDFMNGLTQADVLAGDPAAAVDLITNARKLWSQRAKGQIIAELIYKAENAAGPNYNAAGIETALRQKFRALADNSAKMKMFSPDERQAILNVVRGAPMDYALRLIGKLAVRGPVSGMANLGIGLAMRQPGASVASAMIGEGARGLVTNITKGRVAAVDALVRRGVPLAPPVWREGQGVLPWSLNYIDRSLEGSSREGKPAPVR